MPDRIPPRLPRRQLRQHLGNGIITIGGITMKATDCEIVSQLGPGDRLPPLTCNGTIEAEAIDGTMVPVAKVDAGRVADMDGRRN